jgi:hypothetical protein
MKLCKDCIYFHVVGGRLRCAKINLKVITKVDLVTGDILKYTLEEAWRANPELQREDGLFTSLIGNTCGRRARWFKARRVSSEICGG